MSKDSSGLFSGTSGAKSTSSGRSNAVIKKYSKQRVKDWAKSEQKRLTGRSKKDFNTACVVYDETTGKYYYGRNGAPFEKGYNKNSKLFGKNGLLEKKLPEGSLNIYKVGDGAEVDAVSKALNDGGRLSNLQMTTINVTEKGFGKNKPACENCETVFKGKVKQNYTGWIGEDDGK